MNLGNAKIPLIVIASFGLLSTIYTGSIIPLIGTGLMMGICFALLWGKSPKIEPVLNFELVCYNCKAALEEDAKFCASCQSPVAKSGLLECPSCKELISVGAKFCKHCAAEIIPKAKVHSISSYAGNSVSSPQRAKANTLAMLGAILTSVSAVAFFWGANYTSNWSNRLNAGLGSLVTGQADSTYQLAQYCVGLGAIGFLVGLVLFIVGIAQRQSS